MNELGPTSTTITLAKITNGYKLIETIHHNLRFRKQTQHPLKINLLMMGGCVSVFYNNITESKHQKASNTRYKEEGGRRLVHT